MLDDVSLIIGLFAGIGISIPLTIGLLLWLTRLPKPEPQLDTSWESNAEELQYEEWEERRWRGALGLLGRGPEDPDDPERLEDVI